LSGFEEVTVSQRQTNQAPDQTQGQQSVRMATNLLDDTFDLPAATSLPPHTNRSAPSTTTDMNLPKSAALLDLLGDDFDFS